MGSHTSGTKSIQQRSNAPEMNSPVHPSSSGPKIREMKAFRGPIEAPEFSVSSPFRANGMLPTASRSLSTYPIFQSRAEPYDNLSASMLYRSNIVSQIESNVRGSVVSSSPEAEVQDNAIASSAVAQSIANRPLPNPNHQLGLNNLLDALISVEARERSPVQVAPSLITQPSWKDLFDHIFPDQISLVHHPDCGCNINDEECNYCCSDCDVEEDSDTDSDATIDDPNWPQPDSNSALDQNSSHPLSESAIASTPNHWKPLSHSAMAADKKKAKAQPIYNGPPSYLLDKNRQDPYALGLNPFESEPIRIRGKRKRGMTPDDELDSPVRMIDDMSIPTEMNPWVGKISGIQTTQSQGDFWRERQAQRERVQEYQTLRNKKKEKWDEEMFTGLANFKGSQRGWNGEREPDRQRTLQREEEEENRQEKARMEKAKAEKVKAASAITSKPNKEAISGRNTPQGPRSSKGKKGKYEGTAKEVEDGYAMYQSRAIRSHTALQEHCDSEYAKAVAFMDERVWDPDEIKKQIIAEAAEEERINDRKAARRAGRAGVNSHPENGPSTTKKRRKTSPEERLEGNLGRHWDPVVGKRGSKKPS